MTFESIAAVLLTLLPFIFAFYVVAVAVALIYDDRDPTTTLAWILLLWVLPGFGLILYFFAGRNWASKTRKGKVLRDFLAIRTPFMKPIYEEYAEQADALRSSMDHRFQGRVISAIDQMNDTALLPVVSVDVWPHGSTYFPELIADIRKAEKFVHMQYFIWERDELTEAVCDALMDRLKAGVEVRILNDFLGNILYKKDQLRALRDAGAEWKSDQAQLGRANYRNHRKITVIDGVIGHTGGFNIGQEYIDGKPKYPHWRDTGVRIVGPGVLRLQELFSARWFEVDRESLFTEKYFPRWEGDPGSIMTHVVAHGVEDWWQSSSRAYEIAITAADKRVLIQSPYYVPTESMQEALVNTALSGIEVHFMMTGWPDKKIAFNAAKTFWRPLLEAGAHVYLYDKGFFHAKSMVVDGEAVSVGTMNLDTRSLELHKELMLWVYDEEFARVNEEIFYEDLKECHEVTLADVTGLGAGAKFRNSAARLTSKLI